VDSSSRRGQWLSDSNTKSAAPDKAAVRRILAEPSAYAGRPSTAGNAIRAVGGQRMVDSGITRGVCVCVLHSLTLETLLLSLPPKQISLWLWVTVMALVTCVLVCIVLFLQV